MLRLRILTALIVLPLIILAILYLNATGFFYLIAFVIALAAWEWSQFLKLKEKIARGLYVFAVVAILYATTYLPVLPVLALGLLLWIWCGYIVYRYNSSSGRTAGMMVDMPIPCALFGVCFFVLMGVALHALRQLDTVAINWVLFVFAIVCVTDSGAYFVGRFFGGVKLAPHVSPNKTCSGALGGIFFGLLLTIIFSLYVDLSLSQRIYLCVTSFFAIIASMLGDLMISVLKRQHHIKDSGALLPGHGGILDRVDSIAPAVTVYAFGLLILLR